MYACEAGSGPAVDVYTNYSLFHIVLIYHGEVQTLKLVNLFITAQLTLSNIDCTLVKLMSFEGTNLKVISNDAHCKLKQTHFCQ